MNKKAIIKILEEQREQSQEDVMCILDGIDDEKIITDICQVIVDRFNILKVNIEGKTEVEEPVQLEKCILITNEGYALLKDANFKGQTKVDENGMYYMVWESEGILFKTHNKL